MPIRCLTSIRQQLLTFHCPLFMYEDNKKKCIFRVVDRLLLTWCCAKSASSFFTIIINLWNFYYCEFVKILRCSCIQFAVLQKPPSYLLLLYSSFRHFNLFLLSIISAFMFHFVPAVFVSSHRTWWCSHFSFVLEPLEKGNMQFDW